MGLAFADMANRLPTMPSGNQVDRRTLQRQRTDRKRRFTAALALAGMTQQQFAERHGEAPSQLTRALSGERRKDDLLAKVDAFIAKHLDAAKAGAA